MADGTVPAEHRCRQTVIAVRLALFVPETKRSLLIIAGLLFRTRGYSCPFWPFFSPLLYKFVTLGTCACLNIVVRVHGLRTDVILEWAGMGWNGNGYLDINIPSRKHLPPSENMRPSPAEVVDAIPISWFTKLFRLFMRQLCPRCLFFTHS